MKHVILTSVYLICALILPAQTVTVKDQDTRLPLAGATLCSKQSSASLTTDAKGQVDLSGFKGQSEIVVNKAGYRSLSCSYEEIEAQSFTLFLEPIPFKQYNVVVSATRWQQTADDVPSEIVSVLPSDTAMQNPQTAADLLSVSGKVFIQKSQQGGGSPMIRGFATNRLLYTVDGVRMNTAIFRGGNIQNVISLDPFATEKTEIFFGPGSVVYGSDAIGGVMSFFTLKPHFGQSEQALYTGTLEARYATANQEKTGHFDVNIGWRKWAVLTSFSSFDYAHLRQGAHGPEEFIKPFYVERHGEEDVVVAQDDPLLQIPSAYSQKNLMQKIRFCPDDRWDFQYGFHYSETSPYGRYDRHNRLKNGQPRYAEWNYGPQKWMMNLLTVNHRAQGLFFEDMSVRLAHQVFEESRIERSINSDMRSNRLEHVTAYSVNLDFTKALGARNTLYYGAEYVQNDVKSTGTDEDISTGISEAGPSRYPQATWQSMAIYLNNQYRFSRQFLLQTGLRYNQYLLDAEFDTRFYPFPFTRTSLNDGSLTGSLGAVYRPTDSLVVSANLSTAFRSPNVDDMGKVFDSEPGAVVVPNPDLKAEYAVSADFGLAKTFAKMARIDLSLYYTSLKNALVRRDFTLNGETHIMYDGQLSRVQAMLNAASAHVYGVQAGFTLNLPGGLSFSSDFNFQKGEEELDDGTSSPSRHAAPFFGLTRLGYSNSRFDAQVYAVYQLERAYHDLPQEEQGKTEIYAIDADGNPYAPGWLTLNVKVRVRISGLFSLSAGLENITDKRYRPYSSGISAAGRNMFMSLTAHF